MKQKQLDAFDPETRKWLHVSKLRRDGGSA